MSEISKKYASSSTVVDTDTSVSRIYTAGASYLVGFAPRASTMSYAVHFTEGVGGTKRWTHYVASGADMGSGSDTVMFPFPLRFSTGGLVCSSGGEALMSVCYIPE